MCFSSCCLDGMYGILYQDNKTNLCNKIRSYDITTSTLWYWWGFFGNSLCFLVIIDAVRALIIQIIIICCFETDPSYTCCLPNLRNLRFSWQFIIFNRSSDAFRKVCRMWSVSIRTFRGLFVISRKIVWFVVRLYILSGAKFSAAKSPQICMLITPSIIVAVLERFNTLRKRFCSDTDAKLK